MNQTAFFKGRTVLVTGASGFIGEHLCTRLKGLGALVHGVSRHARDEDYVSRWWQADLDDETATRNLVRAIKPDLVFHLASFVSGKREREYVLPALRSNLLTTVNLLLAASESRCTRVVLTGSLEEPEGDFADAVPASPYAAAKGASSLYARMFHALYGLSVVTARLFMVYGPNQKDRSKLIPYVTLSLLAENVPRLMSGAREVDWIYVDDVIDAYLALAMAQGIEGQTIDVGSGQRVSVRDVVEQLCGIIQSGSAPEFGGMQDRPMERVRTADTTQAASLTGWAPRTSLLEGLRRTVAWYRDNP